MCVQGDSEPSNGVQAGDGGTEEKTGGAAGGGRVEDANIFVRNYKNGQYQDSLHQRDSAGVTVWREST